MKIRSRLRIRCRKYKYYLYRGLPIIVVIGVFFSQTDVSSIAFAQDTINTATSNMAETVSFLNSLLKVIYLILRPLLVVAGMALDNTLVLGEVLHLDAALRKFRTIMTTFANFALGFVVLFHIVKYVVGFKDDSKPVFDIIKKALLAGVGIQISWFAILALLDLSSIAIYAIGAMPLQVLGDTQLDDKTVMTLHTTVDFDKMNDQNSDSNDSAFSVYYSCGNDYYGPCMIQSGYIIGPQNDFEPEVMENFDQSRCAMGGMYTNQNLIDVPGTSQDTCVSLWGEDTAGRPDVCETIKPMNEVVVDVGSENAPQCETMGTILGESKGFVKVLVTIYASLLDFANINLTDEQMTTGGALIVFLIKLLVALALIVPLLALAVVLLVRVAYLWMIIAFAPLLVIKNIFFKDMKLLGNIKIAGAELGDKFEDIIAAIFMPVIVIFALSLGIIFLKITIDGFNPADVERSRLVQQEFGFDRIEDGDVVVYQVSPVEIGYRRPKESYSLSMFLDFFAYIIVNLFAIGLLRMLLFTAMKSSKFLGEIGSKIDKTGRDIMGSLPVIPLPGGGKVGVGTAFGSGYDSLAGRATSKVLERNRAISEESMGKLFGEEDVSSLSDDHKSQIAQKMYNGMSAQKAASEVLGNNYQEGANTYNQQMADYIIQQANNATDNETKKKAIDVMKKELESANTLEKLKKVTNRRSGLTIPEALTKNNTIGKYTIGEGDDKEIYWIMRKDDGSLYLADDDRKPVDTKEKETIDTIELEESQQKDVYTKMVESDGTKELNSIAKEINDQQDGDYHTDGLRDGLGSELEQKDQEGFGKTILKDIESESDLQKQKQRMQRRTKNTNIKKAVQKALASKEKKYHDLGGLRVIKENKDGDITVGRKDFYQEHIDPNDKRTRKDRTEKTDVSTINQTIQEKTEKKGDSAGVSMAKRQPFFTAHPIQKGDTTYIRDTNKNAYNQQTETSDKSDSN